MCGHQAADKVAKTREPSHRRSPGGGLDSLTGVASGEVRFRPSTGPTVNRPSMKALLADPHPDHEIVTLILGVKGASGRVRKLRVYGCKVVIEQAGADRLRYLV